MKSFLSKKTIIFIIVILVIALVYLYFSGSSAPATNGSLLTGTNSGGVGASELSLLNQMKSLQIDTSLFRDPAYASLVDYSVDIVPQNVGRPNPFAPVPGVANPFAADTTTAPATGAAR